jgi:hypothetical protein
VTLSVLEHRVLSSKWRAERRAPTGLRGPYRPRSPTPAGNGDPTTWHYATSWQHAVQPLLEPGEQVQAVFITQTGPSPYWVLVTTLIFFAVKRRIIVATDRAIVIVRAGAMSGTSAKEVMARLPRGTRLGPASGMWAKISVNGEQQWVHKRFHGDIARADAAAGAAAQPQYAGAPLPPPPGA